MDRHIVALEKDKEVFFTLLAPMMHFLAVASTP
jgi:hypothetical protein